LFTFNHHNQEASDTTIAINNGTHIRYDTCLERYRKDGGQQFDSGSETSPSADRRRESEAVKDNTNGNSTDSIQTRPRRRNPAQPV
jgi:hypothetical protein